MDEVFSSEEIERYIIRLVDSTRFPEKYELGELTKLISHGVSPRASIALLKASKAYALIQGRDFVLPQDVKAIAMDVLRHRVSITYKAEAEGKDVEYVVQKILDTVHVAG